MTHILFGLALISASLQTGWAIISEGHLLALPVVLLCLYLGWRKVRSGTVSGTRYAAPVIGRGKTVVPGIRRPLRSIYSASSA